MKPVATGGRVVDGSLRNDDALRLIAATGLDLDYEMVNPYCFDDPIAPHIAAADAGVRIDLDRIALNAEALVGRADQIVVEGVGGWRVPLAPELEVADLAQCLGLPVILVVGMRLGCLNHALLTAEAIARSRCRLAGWVAMFIDPELRAAKQNLQSLKESLSIPFLGQCRYQQSLETSAQHPEGA